jgi:hypothetical protein
VTTLHALGGVFMQRLGDKSRPALGARRFAARIAINFHMNS